MKEREKGSECEREGLWELRLASLSLSLHLPESPVMSYERSRAKLMGRKEVMLLSSKRCVVCGEETLS